MPVEIALVHSSHTYIRSKGKDSHPFYIHYAHPNPSNSHPIRTRTMFVITPPPSPMHTKYYILLILECVFLASISFDTLEEAFGPESLGVLIVNGLPSEYVQLREEVLSSGSYLAALPEVELGKSNKFTFAFPKSPLKKIYFMLCGSIALQKPKRKELKKFQFHSSFLLSEKERFPPFFKNRKNEKNHPLTTHRSPYLRPIQLPNRLVPRQRIPQNRATRHPQRLILHKLRPILPPLLLLPPLNQ